MTSRIKIVLGIAWGLNWGVGVQPVAAQTAPSLPEDYMRTLALRYEAYTGDSTVFPEGCDTPYRDMNEFLQFYESAIVEVVIERGASEKGVADLFAVAEIHSEMKELFPNLSEDNPVDRLIASQLCQFQKIYLGQTKKPGQLRPDPVTSGSNELHKHLLMVAPKLYRDCRRLVQDAFLQQKQLKERVNRLAARRKEIRKARKKGRALVDDLFTSEED